MSMFVHLSSFSCLRNETKQYYEMIDTWQMWGHFQILWLLDQTTDAAHKKV